MYRNYHQCLLLHRFQFRARSFCTSTNKESRRFQNGRLPLYPRLYQDTLRRHELSSTPNTPTSARHRLPRATRRGLHLPHCHAQVNVTRRAASNCSTGSNDRTDRLQRSLPNCPRRFRLRLLTRRKNLPWTSIKGGRQENKTRPCERESYHALSTGLPPPVRRLYRPTNDTSSCPASSYYPQNRNE